MVNQIVLALVLETAFFLFFYRFGFRIASFIGRRVCPVCFAVGSTWLSLLLLNYSGIFPINHYLIALLLSESVVGVSYLVEEFLIVHPKYNFPDYLLKFGIIIYGTASVLLFAFIRETVGIALFLPVIIFGFYALTPINRFNETVNSQSDLLKSKLKKCC